jgi:signal transduction histidine kinase
MTTLLDWLIQQDDHLIRAAALALTADETLRKTVEMSIIAFYQGVQFWVEADDLSKVKVVLTDWVSSRSLETGGEQTSMIPILNTLKRVTWRSLIETLSVDEAIAHLEVIEELFSEATQFVARLETEQTLRNALREAEDARAMIRRLDKSKSDFIAVAAHELKTPLTLIEGYIAMIKGSFQAPGQEMFQTMISGVQSGTLRLREIIEDMIDVSLIEMNALPLYPQPVWINRLVEIVGYDLTATMQARSLRWDFTKENFPDQPTWGDSERLYQAIQKIVSNAIKYTPDGGTISVRARMLPGFMDLQIADSGIGIAPENLGRIFEKFSSQGDVATHSSGKVKFKGGGPGLGLAIAKGILESHGGSIWAESPGYDEKALPGSTFHLMIPMIAPSQDNPLAELYQTPGAAKGPSAAT